MATLLNTNEAHRGHRIQRLLRWLVPIAAIPVLALLAYGFRVNPREVPSPLVGRLAPSFSLSTLDAQPISLESLRGNVVVLNFWASWCYPACYEEAPILEQGWRAYRARGLRVVGINIQDKSAAAEKFVRQFEFTFPNAQDHDGKVSVDYGIYGVPETFFIDRQARIRRKHVGALTVEAFRSNVERLLDEGGTPPSAERASAANQPAELRRQP